MRFQAEFYLRGIPQGTGLLEYRQEPWAISWFCPVCGGIWARAVPAGDPLSKVSYCACEDHGSGSFLHEPCLRALPSKLFVRELGLSDERPFPHAP